MTQGSFSFALFPHFLGSEVAFTQGLPDHKGDSGVLIPTCEGIRIEVNPWQSVKTRVVAVECLIAVQQVVVGNQTRINIAIFQVNGRFKVLMNVRNFGAVSPAKCATENQQLSCCENDLVLVKSGMATRFAIEVAGHLLILSVGCACVCLLLGCENLP